MTTIRPVALESVEVGTDDGVTERWLESVKRRGPRSDTTRFRMGATKIGVSVEEYAAQVKVGRKWCSGHKRWCQREDFGRHKRMRDGIDSMCQDANRTRVREYWQRKAEARTA